MISLPRLTLRLRLLLSIIAIVVLFTTTNITYQLSSDNLNQRLDNLQNAVAGQLASATLRQQLENQQKEILVLDALRDSGNQKLNTQEVENALDDLDMIQTQLNKLSSYPDNLSSESFQAFNNQVQDLQILWSDYYQGFNKNQQPQIQLIKKSFSQALKVLGEFEALEIQDAEQQTLSLQRTARLTDRITLAIYLFTVLMTISLGYLLIRFTSRSLKELNTGTVEIGEGDLDYHIPVNSDDELGDLAIAFNEMSAKLRNAMAQVHQSKEKADQANRAKTNFLANMSHELRTPLNAIIGYSEMILEDYRDEKVLDEQQAIEDLQRILSSGRHLLQLINDVLDLAKIESGNMTVFNETFDCVEIIKELLKTMRPTAKKNGNTLVLETSENVPKIHNDAVKFRQLFLNLLSNACKFTSDGKITVLVTFNQQNRHLVFHVTDTGIGMTPSQLNRIFEAFVQADSSTSKKYGGTGLGLSICKQFVELMDGTLDVTSAQGQGTTFSVTLPTKSPWPMKPEVIPAENQQELNLPIDNSNDNKIASSHTTIADDGPQTNEAANSLSTQSTESLARVLIIDDDPEARKLLLRHLEKEGYLAIEATSAKQGIEIAKAEQPDLILLDLMMPDIDGWTALSVLKESTETRHIPVVLQSMLDEKNLGFDLGAAEFLPKPVDRQRMATVLRHLNPQDRRGTALLLAPESESRDLLLDELTDEAWQCMTATSLTQAIERIRQKRPDLILLGLGIPFETVLEILDMLSQELSASTTHNEDSNNSANNNDNPVKVPPIYVVSETSLGNSKSRRLDLSADQIILFDKKNKRSLSKLLSQLKS